MKQKPKQDKTKYLLSTKTNKNRLLEDVKQETLDFISKELDIEKKRVHKQETLEEDKNVTIIQFLCGSHSYEGVWFGDKHPNREGFFWWRSILQEQDKNKYSEEDFKGIVYNMVGALACANNMTFNGAILDELFKQFKNK